ncbi:MAG: 5-oxoprolinase subunit PxpB [Chitinophagaceae bacterium]
MQQPFQIFALGDSAITLDYGNTISETLNEKVLSIQQWLYIHRFEGLKDVITAYSSVTVVYDPFMIRKHYHVHGTVASWITALLEKAATEAFPDPSPEKQVIRIPVCYEGIYAPDLEALANQLQLAPEEVVRLHTEPLYRVYMIGFLPGFSYMGEVHPKIAAPRKSQAVPVPAGSVGIAGTQTGIYPLRSPGGWHIIGRTPLMMFDQYNKVPAKLQAGIYVQFFPVSETAFMDEQAKQPVITN